MVCETAIKKDKCVAFIGKWMQFENIVFSEISQTHKLKCHMTSLT